MNVINICRSRRKVSWLSFDSATLDSKTVNVRSYSSRVRDQNTALPISSVHKWLLAPCIIRTRESKKSSTFGIHWAAMFLIGTASLSFCSGYGSAHLHKITRQNICRHRSCNMYVENTLKRGNIKRNPYIDLDIHFCKLWTQILQVEINIDISTFIFWFGHTYRNFNIYIEISTFWSYLRSISVIFKLRIVHYSITLIMGSCLTPKRRILLLVKSTCNSI